MGAKLTLRLDEELIKIAKNYAAKEGKSVSRLVADFFRILKNKESQGKQKIPPTVSSLKGILKDKNISEKDYGKYLEDKYL